MNNQLQWSRSRDQLAQALASQGFPAELANLMAKQLGSPRAIDRMTSYIYQAHPRSVEMLADEMLAICDEIDAWRQRKTSQEAQAHYNNMRFYGMIGGDDEERDE